jgi:hypothetical protein
MADPASILGLIAASLTITIRAATIGKDMHTLVTKYRTTDKKVKQLSVHVAAVRIAARSLSSWLEGDAVGSEEVEEIKGELLEVLTACSSLLLDLQEHVAKALAGAENMGFTGAVHYIWDEDIIKETTETLHQQETVLILMLHALERLSRREQRARLEDHVVQQTLTMAKRPSSSIFGVRSEARSSTRFSYATETSEKIDAVFTFDMEVMTSTVYRNAFTSLFRRNQPRQDDVSSQIIEDSASTFTVTATESMSQEGALHSATGHAPFPDGNVGTSGQFAKPVQRQFDDLYEEITGTLLTAKDKNLETDLEFCMLDDQSSLLDNFTGKSLTELSVLPYPVEMGGSEGECEFTSTDNNDSHSEPLVSMTEKEGGKIRLVTKLHVYPKSERCEKWIMQQRHINRLQRKGYVVSAVLRKTPGEAVEGD